MYTEGDGGIRQDGRRLTNFTVRINRYAEPTDTLHGALRIDGITRRFRVSATAYRDDDGLRTAVMESGGDAEFYAPIGTIREALDLLAFPN